MYEKKWESMTLQKPRRRVPRKRWAIVSVVTGGERRKDPSNLLRLLSDHSKFQENSSVEWWKRH